MTGRERIFKAINYQPVDKAPLRCIYTMKVAYYEHGDKLNDLLSTLPGDFEPFRRMPIETPQPGEIDAQGNYHSFQKDEWGVNWQYRIFGIAGIPYEHPVKTQEDAEKYIAPAAPYQDAAQLERLAQRVRKNQEAGYFTDYYAGGLYERMIALYGDENVLCDMYMDEPGIHHMADQVIEYDRALIEAYVKAGADGIFFMDDCGSQRALIMGTDVWRRFIKPRIKKAIQPAVDAGMNVHFHSCGMILPILEDLREIGVKSIWPQIPLYNMEELAGRCRELGLAIEIHTDRANTMTYGTPEQVKELVKREVDTFKMMDGGSWFRLEIDNGVPFANLEALVEAIAEYR